MISSSLPVVHYSVIVLRRAVERSFPGGVEAFERAFPTSRANRDLSVHASMSLDDVDFVLDGMFKGGLIPGQDIAVGYMYHGMLLDCPGVTFEREGSEHDFLCCWTVSAVEADAAGTPPWDGRVAFTPDNSLGYFWVSPEAREGPQEALEVVEVAKDRAAPDKPKEGLRRLPTRVVFGTGPVHWLFYDDEEDDAD